MSFDRVISIHTEAASESPYNEPLQQALRVASIGWSRDVELPSEGELMSLTIRSGERHFDVFVVYLHSPLRAAATIRAGRVSVLEEIDAADAAEPSASLIITCTVAAVTLLVLLAWLVIKKKGRIKSIVLKRLLNDRFITVINVIAEVGDLVSDAVACVQVLSEHTLRRFWVAYVVFIVVSSIVSLATIVFDVYVLQKPAAPIPSRPHILEADILTSLQIERRQGIRCYLKLLLVIFEDAPFLVMNIIIMLQHWSTFIFISLLISSLLVGVKLRTFGMLGEIRERKVILKQQLQKIRVIKNIEHLRRGSYSMSAISKQLDSPLNQPRRFE